MRDKNLVFSRRVGFVVVVVLFVVGLVVYLWKQFSGSLLYGIDGPYYVVQVRSLLESGGLRYGDPPLAFWLLGFFSWLFGDVFVGVKVGSSLLVLLAVFPVCLVARRLSG